MPKARRAAFRPRRAQARLHSLNLCHRQRHHAHPHSARALGHAIFTEAETWGELRRNVLEAVSLHFEDTQEQPRLVQSHYVKDELIPVEAA
jgi:hypothetical protein